MSAATAGARRRGSILDLEPTRSTVTRLVAAGCTHDDVCRALAATGVHVAASTISLALDRWSNGGVSSRKLAPYRALILDLHDGGASEAEILAALRSATGEVFHFRTVKAMIDGWRRETADWRLDPAVVAEVEAALAAGAPRREIAEDLQRRGYSYASQGSIVRHASGQRVETRRPASVVEVMDEPEPEPSPHEDARVARGRAAVDKLGRLARAGLAPVDRLRKASAILSYAGSVDDASWREMEHFRLILVEGRGRTFADGDLAIPREGVPRRFAGWTETRSGVGCALA